MRHNRKLIQIALDYTRPKDPPLSLGHASILASLKQHQLPVISKSWAVNHFQFNADKVVESILSYSLKEPVNLSMGAFVWNEKYIQQISKRLKAEKFPGKIILGGPQVSYVKDNHALEKYYPNADIFIRGYAEAAMVQWMQALDEDAVIKGIHYRGIPDLAGSATADLESLPSPFLTGLIPPQPFIRWETQRGCPFRCSFCQHREPAKDYLTRRHLNRTRIEAEINWITQNPIIQDIAVLDPTFNSGPHHIETLDLLKLAGYTGKIALQCRAEMVVPDFIRSVTELNEQAKVVLEFGLQTIHKEEQKYIERPTNLKKVEQVLQAFIARNIDIEVSLIFGLPGQTLASFQKSIDYCIQLKVPTIHAFPLMLLRGTNMFDNKEVLGLIESNNISIEAVDRIQHDIPHVIASKSFSYADWQEMAKMAAWLETEYNPAINRKPVSTATVFYQNGISDSKKNNFCSLSNE